MNPLARWLIGDGRNHLSTAQRATHTYVIGQPGAGKSRALECWALQDILAGNGVGVVDPHGDLFSHLVEILANIPQVWNRVVIFDPCDRNWVARFNPLEAMSGIPEERLALFLTDVVIKIWGLDTASAPRLIWLLTNCFLALSDLKLSLLDLPRFLSDARYREGLLPRVLHESVRNYFAWEFPKNPAGAHQWVTPVLNKIGGLIFDPDLRLMLTSPSTFNFRDILDRKLVLLVHLPKGILGEESSALMAAFIVAHLQKAALSRADSRERTPFYLYLDEFQNYTTDNVKDILSESRKYGLSLTLAHQYLDQLSPDLRSAVLNTTGTMACFRVGYHDAAQLAKEIFPSADYLASFKPVVEFRQMNNWPVITIDERRDTLGWEGLAHRLTSLSPRQFWAKRRGPYSPAKLKTLDMPDRMLTAELQAKIMTLRAVSGRRFGISKAQVQRDHTPRGAQAPEAKAKDNDSMWGN